MGTGWRRAFCTTIPRDPEASSQQQKSATPSPSPRTGRMLGFLSSSRSYPSTPRLRCRTVAEAAAASDGGSVDESRMLRCKTAPNSTSNTPRLNKSPKKQLLGSNPSSPRSPLKLSLFKNSFKFRSSGCGVCSSSVKTGQGTAIYTAECGHVFHFPCIADHVRAQRALICPVCNSSWADVPLLGVHKNLSVEPMNDSSTTQEITPKAHVEDKRVVVDSSPRTVKPRVETRCYNDDEPLLSPAAGARFCPIPEVEEGECEQEEEDGEEDEGEFQGFFVNRNPSSSFKYSDEVPADDIREPRQVEVKLLPESTVVSVGRAHETHAVVLRVKAPPPLASGQTGSPHRAPIDLVAVLDVSGSMVGPKLQMLKRAMRLIISSLGPADRLSVVAFSTKSKRLLALRRMTQHGQRLARQIIDRLICGNGSGVADALRKAAKVLEDRRERNPVASIMLLSDGQDTTSKSNKQLQALAVHPPPTSARFAHIEIPVHSFGFGSKRGYSHDPAEDTFSKCVGGLLSVVVQDLRIQVGIASGSAPAEIPAIYSCNGRPTAMGAGSIRVGDLYAGEEREFLVELKVGRSHSVMSVRSCYKDPATREVVYSGDRTLLVPRPRASTSSAAARSNRLRGLFLTTRAIAEARRLVDHHNELTSAHHLLESARALLIQGGGGSEPAEEHIRALDAELAEVCWRNQQMIQRTRGTDLVDVNREPLTSTSAWRSAEKLARMAMMKKSLSRVSDLHGFENARF